MLLPSFDAPLPILAIGLVGVALAAAQDLKTREVPDALSSGLIATGFAAAILRISFGAPIGVLINTTLGFAFGYGVGALLYFAKQWGGGDAKLLAGLGALFGFFADGAALSLSPSPASGAIAIGLSIVTLVLAWLARHEGWRSVIATLSVGALIAAGSLFVRFGSLGLTDPVLLYYLVAIFMAGALWGVGMLVVVAVRHDAFRPFGRSEIAMSGAGAILAIAVAVAGTVANETLRPASGWFITTVALVAVLAAVSPLLLIVSRRLEATAFRRSVEPRELVLGDWLAESVVDTKGRIVVDRRNPGFTQEQISRVSTLWSKGRVKKILIKDGIAFVPAFLIALVAMLVVSIL